MLFMKENPLHQLQVLNMEMADVNYFATFLCKYHLKEF